MNKKHTFRIPEPCQEDWTNMSPSAKGRFCDSCAKEVKDFSSSSPDEIAATLLSTEGKVCGRFRKEQIVSPEPRLIDLLPTGAGQAAKVAATALALFSLDQGMAQGDVMPRGRVAYVEAPEQAADERFVRGTVREANGELLAFANVFFVDDHGASHGVTTDFNGRFELEIPTELVARSEITLHVTFIGYQQIDLMVRLKDAIDVEINFDMPEIFLMGDIAFPEPLEEEPSNEIKKEFTRIKDWAVESKDIQGGKIELRKLKDRGLTGLVEQISPEDLATLTRRANHPAETAREEVYTPEEPPVHYEEMLGDVEYFAGDVHEELQLTQCRNMEAPEGAEDVHTEIIEVTIGEVELFEIGEVILFDETDATNPNEQPQLMGDTIITQSVSPPNHTTDLPARIEQELNTINTSDIAELSLRDEHSVGCIITGGTPGTYGDIPVTPEAQESSEELAYQEQFKAIETSTASLRLFPNPVMDILHVTPSEPCTGRFDVIGFNGTVVLSGQYVNDIIQIDISHLAAGPYLVSLETLAGELLKERFVVER